MEKNTKLMYKELYAVCLTAFIILSYVSFYFGNNVNKIYYYGFAISIPIGLIAYHFYSKFKYLNEVDELKKKWGKKIEKKRQMKLIKRLFDSVEKDDKDKFYIDDQTWNDLTMDEIYPIIDRTITTPGEEALYLLLRSPFIKIPKIIHRKELINKLQKDDDFREKIQSNLLIIGKQKGNTALPLIFGSSLPERPVYAFLYDIMALLAAASIISVAFLGIKAVPTFIMPVFFINLFIHYSTDQKINVDISSIKYLSKIIRVSKKMSKELDPARGLSPLREQVFPVFIQCQHQNRSQAIADNRLSRRHGQNGDRQGKMIDVMKHAPDDQPVDNNRRQGNQRLFRHLIGQKGGDQRSQAAKDHIDRSHGAEQIGNKNADK